MVKTTINEEWGFDIQDDDICLLQTFHPTHHSGQTLKAFWKKRNKYQALIAHEILFISVQFHNGKNWNTVVISQTSMEQCNILCKGTSEKTFIRH